LKYRKRAWAAPPFPGQGTKPRRMAHGPLAIGEERLLAATNRHDRQTINWSVHWRWSRNAGESIIRHRPSGASHQAKPSGAGGEAGQACRAWFQPRAGAAARKRRGSSREAQSGLTGLGFLLPLLGHHGSAIQGRSLRERGPVVRKKKLEYSQLPQAK
jgi:hypothetical protein